jgi:hypothetical protein
MASCPNAELAAKHLVNLPTHLRVTADDVQHFMAAMEKLMKAQRTHLPVAKRMQSKKADYAEVPVE